MDVVEVCFERRKRCLANGDALAFGRTGVDTETRVALGMNPAATVVGLDLDESVSRVWCEISVINQVCHVSNLSRVLPVVVVMDGCNRTLKPLPDESQTGSHGQVPTLAISDAAFTISLTSTRFKRPPLEFEISCRLLNPELRFQGQVPDAVDQKTSLPSYEMAEAMKRRPAQWDTLRELTWEYRHFDRLGPGKLPLPLSNARISRRLGIPAGTVENRLSELAKTWIEFRQLDPNLTNQQRRVQLCEKALLLRTVDMTAEFAGWELDPDA